MKVHEEKGRTPSAVNVDNGHGHGHGETRYSVEEIASRLRVSPRRIHALVRSGQLACVQVTPRTRIFTEEQIAAFERARTRSASPTPNPSFLEVKSPEKMTSRSSSTVQAVKVIDRPPRQLIASPTNPASRSGKERKVNKLGSVQGESNMGELDKASLRKEMQKWR